MSISIIISLCFVMYPFIFLFSPYVFPLFSFPFISLCTAFPSPLFPSLCHVPIHFILFPYFSSFISLVASPCFFLLLPSRPSEAKKPWELRRVALARLRPARHASWRAEMNSTCWCLLPPSKLWPSGRHPAWICMKHFLMLKAPSFTPWVPAGIHGSWIYQMHSNAVSFHLRTTTNVTQQASKQIK